MYVRMASVICWNAAAGFAHLMVGLSLQRAKSVWLRGSWNLHLLQR